MASVSMGPSENDILSGAVLSLVRSISVATCRAVVAHEAWRFGGYGSEVASGIYEELFDTLEAPIGRVGAQSAPIPFSPPLEAAVVPGAEDIADAVLATLT